VLFLKITIYSTVSDHRVVSVVPVINGLWSVTPNIV